MGLLTGNRHGDAMNQKKQLRYIGRQGAQVVNNFFIFEEKRKQDFYLFNQK